MLPRVTGARYVSAYTVWLRFSDGAEGEVDLSTELHGEVFEPLRRSVPNHLRRRRPQPE